MISSFSWGSSGLFSASFLRKCWFDPVSMSYVKNVYFLMIRHYSQSQDVKKILFFAQVCEFLIEEILQLFTLYYFIIFMGTFDENFDFRENIM